MLFPTKNQIFQEAKKASYITFKDLLDGDCLVCWQISSNLYREKVEALSLGFIFGSESRRIHLDRPIVACIDLFYHRFD